MILGAGDFAVIKTLPLDSNITLADLLHFILKEILPFALRVTISNGKHIEKLVYKDKCI